MVPSCVSAPDGGPGSTSPSCVAKGITYIYLLTLDGNLLSYYPPTGAFQTIGPLVCTDVNGSPYTANPFSMAVDRSGTAYSVFEDGSLFRISTATGACQKTPFVPDQQGFDQVRHGLFCGHIGSWGDPLRRPVQLWVGSDHPVEGVGKGGDSSTFELAESSVPFQRR